MHKLSNCVKCKLNLYFDGKKWTKQFMALWPIDAWCSTHVILYHMTIENWCSPICDISCLDSYKVNRMKVFDMMWFVHR